MLRNPHLVTGSSITLLKLSQFTLLKLPRIDNSAVKVLRILTLKIKSHLKDYLSVPSP